MSFATRKRKFEYRDAQNSLIPDPRIYATRADESTLVIETGGTSIKGDGVGGDSITGEGPSIGVGGPFSFNLSSALDGVNKLQYNNFFWSNDFFTTNQNNNTVGVIVSCYNSVLGVYSTIIVPLPIAMGKMTYASGGLDGPTPDNTIESNAALQKQFAYELNLLWNTIGKTYSTWYLSKTLWDKLFVDYSYMPLFENVWYPPLEFMIIENGHLAIVFNKDKIVQQRGEFYNRFYFAFNLCNINSAWWTKQNYYNRSSNPNALSPFFTDSTIPKLNVSTNLATRNGWMPKGHDVFGFGRWQIDEKTFWQDISPTDADVIFNETTHLPEEAIPVASLDDWLVYVKSRNLKTQVLMGPHFTKLCPSRFYCVISETFSRNQKTPTVISNNPYIQANSTVGLFFYDSGTGNFFQEGGDNTLNDNINPPLSSLYTESKQRLDFQVVDEYKQTLKSFGAAPNFDATTNTFTTSDNPTAVNDQYYWTNCNYKNQPNTVPLAPVYSSILNPNTTGDPIGQGMLSVPIADQQMIWGTAKFSANQNVQTNPDCEMTHFFRVFAD